MSNIVCVYHAKCPDGMAAAKVVIDHYKKSGKEVTLIEGYYQSDLDLSQFKDKLVYIVDFSFSESVMDQICEHAREVILIDHHKTAIEALGLWINPKCQVVFDTAKSGCRLTWEYFNKDIQPPDYIKFIEDRDMWKFNYNETKLYCCATGVNRNFDDFIAYLDTPTERILSDGVIIRKVETSVIEAVKSTAADVVFHGAKIKFVINPYVGVISEALNILASENEECKMALSASYLAKGNEWLYSLRSVGDVDVSSIAKQYGGGGHKNAAGFKLDHLLPLMKLQ